MPDIRHIIQLLLLIVVLALLAWLAFYVLIFVLIVGTITAAWFYLRRFLIAKGILNVSAGGGFDAPANGSTIEVEYVEIQSQDSTPKS